MHNSTIVKHRRRREGKTNYRVRYGLLKSGQDRLVIRKSSKNIIVQIIRYEEKGDKILVSVNSKQLVKFGWKAGLGNVPASYLTGFLLGNKAKGKVDGVVLDIGNQVSVKGARLYAALKGVIDAGIDVPHSKEILPSQDRIEGKHIADWAGNAGGNNFKKYGIDPKDIQKNFAEVKQKING